MSAEMVDVVHSSVLKDEVIDLLRPGEDECLVLDATVGEGGHAEAFLSAFEHVRVVAVDADPNILRVAEQRLAPFSDRVRLYNDWFNHFLQTYSGDMPRPDRILFDLGISSFHYRRANRGFSFKRDEPLDMRLDSGLELTAADIVNDYPEEALADLLYEYGEERYSRRIARAVCRARALEPIESSRQLAEIIEASVPAAYRHGRIHAATRSFQALRIAVNGELARLQQSLDSAVRLLKKGGRIGVISFHSLEDRIVKRFFRDKSRSCTCPPEWPICKCGGIQLLEVITRRPVRPVENEVSANAASRSARLRVAEKVGEDEE